MSNPSTPDDGRGFRLAARALLTTATAAAFVGAASVTASAAPVVTTAHSVTANVHVNSTITLAVNETSFNLSGNPGDLADGDHPVTGTVTTNNSAGYSVNVLAAADNLAPSITGNPDTIPIAALKVTNATGAYTALSATAPVVTATKASRSGLDGDDFSDDYQISIPDVNSDTYTATLNYTATTLA